MTDTPDFAAGIAADRLTDDRPVAGRMGDADVVLVRHRGKVCALSAACTHLGAPLAEGLVVDGEIRCPWHHARFALETGEAVGAPAFEPLDRFAVVEENDLVRVVGMAAPLDTPVAAPEIGRVVIVGGGAAGHACADMLARAGAGPAVTLLSDDHDAPYDRTFCSKQYLNGEEDRAACALPMPGLGRPAPWVRTDTPVLRIDPIAKEVVVRGGEHIGYDTLVLATGAAPIAPDFDGADREGVHVLRTLRDADALIAAAKAGSDAVVLGGNFIALEVAASLVERGMTVAVVTQDAVPLAAITGPEMGGVVQALHERKGTTFHLGRTVAAFDGAAATLDDGTRIACSLLVAGIGVEPRTDLATDAGIAVADRETGGGVVVDGTLATSAPDIYAIGDIARYPDPRLGRPIRVEHWVHAQRQGQYLARRLLGVETGDYGDTPFFWTLQHDLGLGYVGHVARPDDRRIDGDVASDDVAVFFREDGVDRALLTNGRETESLATEARWDA